MGIIEQLKQLGVPQKNNTSTYSDQFINDRVDSGRDKQRAANVYETAHKARAGDAAALDLLAKMAGLVPGHGLATADAKNVARREYERITGKDTPYLEANDGGGFGASLGKVLKTAAPATALIPGVGPLLGAGLAAGANSAGSVLQGQGLDAGGSLKDALLSYGGSKVLGAVGGGSAPADGMGKMAGGGGGVLGKLGGLAKGAVTKADGSADLGKILGAGSAVLGYMDERGQRKSAESRANAHLALRQRQLQMAEGDYDSRQPLRDAVMAKLAALAGNTPRNPIFRERGEAERVGFTGA